MEKDHLNAEEILENITQKDSNRGSLRIFFGYAAGVGKTYAMLKEAHEQLLVGKNVVIGYVEPHDRIETNNLLTGLPIIPTKVLNYKGIALEELDVDQVMREAPDIVLVDELAHTNAVGSRNKKRYQDIEELLKAGINVYTTMNVQHLESLNDIVEEITGVAVKETVPDKVLKNAYWKVIDIEPDELIQRLEAGKIYSKKNSQEALKNFFIKSKINLLRGLAIQKISDHINQNGRGNRSSVQIQTKFLTVIEEEYPKMSETCIRWTARLAQSLNTEWIVLYLKPESEDSTPDEEKMLSLAKKLGAETITVVSENYVDTMVDYIRLLRITDLVMGKNLQKNWIQRLFVTDAEDLLLKKLPFIDIHLVPYKEKGTGFSITSIQSLFPVQTKDFLISIFSIILATLITEFMRYIHLNDQNLMLVYMLFIALTARFTSGYLWSSLTSISSVLLFNWFFVEPLYSLSIYKRGYPLTLIIMLFVSLLISNLVVRIRKKANNSMEKEQQLEILYELNSQYVVAAKLQDLYQSTTNYLSVLLNREVILYNLKGEVCSFHSPEKRNYLLKSKEESGVAFWVGKNQEEAGYGTDTLVGAKGYYLPVIFENKTMAILGLERDNQKIIDNNQINYLRLIAIQLAISIEQMQLKEEKQKILVDNEKERTRSNLLRAISHDIRTPLTGISGLVETMIDDEDTGFMKPEMKKKILTDIQDESNWLIRMVENLLSITRISSDTTVISKSSEPIEEIIASVIRRVKKAYPKAKLQAELPDKLIFLKLDPILIEQALFNLIDNAIRHGNSDFPIVIAVKEEQGEIVFIVENSGMGMNEQQFKRILTHLTIDKDQPIDSKNGLGIGLTIVKTIVKAHHGHFFVENNDEKTQFIFTIPKEAENEH